VVPDPIRAIEQRDQGLQKLSDLTKAFFFGALGLLAVFSVIAAVTNPGKGQTSSNVAAIPITSDSSTSQATDDHMQPQPPPAGSFKSGSGRPIAVSGGSH
jgi:hypothetical protein